MKVSITVLDLLLFAHVTVALPERDDGWHLRRADELDDNVVIVDLQITNEERFPGKIFKGTAESIHTEIKALDPDALLNVTDVTMTTSNPASLDKRSTFNCGWGGWINNYSWWCFEGIDYLLDLGNFMCDVDPMPSSSSPVTCARVSCSHACGMFLCNKTTKRYKCKCGSIAKDVRDVASQCGESILDDNFYRARGARDFSDHYIGLKHQSC